MRRIGEHIHGKTLHRLPARGKPGQISGLRTRVTGHIEHAAGRGLAQSFKGRSIKARPRGIQYDEIRFRRMFDALGRQHSLVERAACEAKPFGIALRGNDGIGLNFQSVNLTGSRREIQGDGAYPRIEIPDGLRAVKPSFDGDLLVQQRCRAGIGLQKRVMRHRQQQVTERVGIT